MTVPHEPAGRINGITTHVLDTACGKPAAGVPVRLELRQGEGWVELGRGETDADGRLRTLLDGRVLEAGVHRITFDTGAYFRGLDVQGFYPEAAIVFEVRDATEHHHVPLLLQPYGYATYRGS
ncbi:MAG: hydroxyisourate hydrolase [Polyangiaceae bacterium]